jgi:hypothetical protein
LKNLKETTGRGKPTNQIRNYLAALLITLCDSHTKVEKKGFRIFASILFVEKKPLYSILYPTYNRVFGRIFYKFFDKLANIIMKGDKVQ